MFESRRARHLIELKRVRRIALHLDRLPTNQTLYPTENYGWTAQLSPHQAIHSQRQVSAAHRLSVWYVRRHQLGVANENTGVGAGALLSSTTGTEVTVGRIFDMILKTYARVLTNDLDGALKALRVLVGDEPDLQVAFGRFEIREEPWEESS